MTKRFLTTAGTVLVVASQALAGFYYTAVTSSDGGQSGPGARGGEVRDDPVEREVLVGHLEVPVGLDEATKRFHLTARQAGMLARSAGAKKIILFHFSPKYKGSGNLLVGEAMEAFNGQRLLI